MIHSFNIVYQEHNLHIMFGEWLWDSEEAKKYKKCEYCFKLYNTPQLRYLITRIPNYQVTPYRIHKIPTVFCDSCMKDFVDNLDLFLTKYNLGIIGKE